MTPVSDEQLERIPFVRLPLGDGRILPALLFYVDGEWHSWAALRGKLLKLEMWPHEADFFADRPERESDQHFPLLDMIAQRTLDVPMFWHYRALWNDLQGLSASLARMRLLHANRYSEEYGIRRCVETEIENMAVMCRSIFDVLQTLSRLHVERLQILDGSQPMTLPGSFRKMVLKNDIVRSADEIAESYRLPLSLAAWYARHAPFFMKLRTIRDRIVHGGTSIETLPTDRGFAVFREDDPFDGLYAWPDAHGAADTLAPVRPVMAVLARRTMDACDDFAATLQSLARMPELAVPGLRLHTRGMNDREFMSIDAVIAEARWDDDLGF